jgi:hypothetical protein
MGMATKPAWHYDFQKALAQETYSTLTTSGDVARSSITRTQLFRLLASLLFFALFASLR